MPLISIISDFLLFATTSLVFSITVLCFILFLRGGDRYIRGFLGILVPLVIQIGLSTVVTYISRIGVFPSPERPSSEFFALFVTFVSVFCSAAILFFLSRYLIDLIPIPEPQKRLGRRIVNLISLVFLFCCLFAVFFINRGDWFEARKLAMNDLFLWASGLLTAHGIAALFYWNKAENREQENLLRSISWTFLPLLPFCAADQWLSRDNSFKLIYLVYAVFSVSLYLFISRHYFRSREPSPGSFLPNPRLLAEMGFSAREKELLRLLVLGKTNREIGQALFISVNTVKTHIKNIYGKLRVSNRVQLLQSLKAREED